ncbi:MAG TPA: glycine cleavage system aminomethyltransferase GcvT [Tepidisphaeraceae bacterium]|jgi:aminomethyltransferase|nr:glycine cleavage system aminomethyltransferase GcvT [Tepidisphaeraceae bacterium]
MLKRTPFYDFHVAAGAKMVDFAGWEMPLLYRGIVEEHQQTRHSGSMFDVSHMGRLHFSGKDALAFLDRVLTRNVAKMLLGQSRYSLVCNEAGGVLDDVIVSRDAKHYLVVCNAANRAKLVEHFAALRKQRGYDLDFSDQTESTAMVAIQGPKVIDRLAEILPGELKELKRYTFQTINLLMAKLTVFRSGYTGEDGVEIILPAKLASMAMKMLAGKMDKPDATIKPAGLGARDTLRLEAGMPLYGHELSESIDPLSADLAWAVDLSKDFIGAAALRTIAEQRPKRKLIGLELTGRRIARQDTPITVGGATVGVVTSGTFSPTLQKSIAMAYIDADHATEGTEVAADLKGVAEPARIVPLPFYTRPK